MLDHTLNVCKISKNKLGTLELEQIRNPEIGRITGSLSLIFRPTCFGLDLFPYFVVSMVLISFLVNPSIVQIHVAILL